MERHSCKVCGRSFPCGRSMGGHMRSHVVLSSRLEAEEKLVGRYRLRENPRKSWRLVDASVDKEKGTLCTKCGKGFGSWNSLFEHMKCHSEITRDELNEVDEEEETLESNGSYEEEIWSQSYSDVTAIALPSRRRRRSRRFAAISAASSQPAPSSEYEKEQEDGAFCLLMLSRGAGSATDSSDKISVVLEKDGKTSESDFPKIGIVMNELKRDQSLPSESGFSLDDGDDCDQGLKKRKPKASSFSSESFDELADEKKNLNSAVAESGKRTIVPSQCDSDSGMHNSKKRSRYECTTCNKSFHSYQALGGHRASHKKIKESPAAEELSFHNYSSQTAHRQPGKARDHECSICGKVFASGQALGGHKRSHLVAANSAASAGGGFGGGHDYPVVIEIGQKASKLSLLDLNLPAPDDESSYNSNGSIEC